MRNPHELQKYLRTRNSFGRLLKTSLARIGIVMAENERILRSLKDRHAGRRCFVIGNGPSLRLEDLEKLQGEVTFASNRIYLAFPSVDWRPSYFTCIDTIYAENYADEINDLDLFKIFPDYLQPYLSRSGVTGTGGDTVYVRRISGRFDLDGRYRGHFSGDAMRGFHTGPTVTILNLQLAYYMGCRTIYLLGVDGGYRVSAKRASHTLHGEVAVSEGERNHFHPGYRVPGDAYVIPLQDETEIGYAACREFLERRGVGIYNASRETRVEAFDRIDIDRVL